jgi:hypothetical protein
MTSVTLPHNFTARIYQEDFFAAMNDGVRRAILVWNRRAGKDTSAWNFLIYTAWEKKGIYYYIFPTAIQGRKVLWDGMTNDGLRFIDFIPKILIKSVNNQEMKIVLRNGSLIQVLGSDNYNSIMGTNPSGCIFSEFSLQNPNAWNYVRPILDANGGWSIFVFTPRGTNHAKDLFDMARKDENKEAWFCQLLTNNETKILSDKDIKKLRDEEMSEDMIQQEWYCSFTLGIQGSYYAKYLQEARDEMRIGHIPHDKSQRVFTSWDIGLDCTAMVFFQLAGNQINIIDYYEAPDEEMIHYVQELQKRPYIYDEHFAPSDASKREQINKHSIRGVVAELGVDFTKISTLEYSIDKGIEFARQVFPRVFIDEKKCVKLIRCLENYRREWDDERKIYRSKPVHDRWSHGADAFRYMAIAMKMRSEAGRGPGDDEVERLRDRFQPVFER